MLSVIREHDGLTVKDIYDLLDLHLSEIRSSLHRQRDLIRKVEVYESAD